MIRIRQRDMVPYPRFLGRLNLGWAGHTNTLSVRPALVPFRDSGIINPRETTYDEFSCMMRLAGL